MQAHPKDIPLQPQRQDSLAEQLEELRYWAVRLGMYDASDYLAITVDLIAKKVAQ